jgi:hypothetical protein
VGVFNPSKELKYKPTVGTVIKNMSDSNIYVVLEKEIDIHGSLGGWNGVLVYKWTLQKINPVTGSRDGSPITIQTDINTNSKPFNETFVVGQTTINKSIIPGNPIAKTADQITYDIGLDFFDHPAAKQINELEIGSVFRLKPTEQSYFVILAFDETREHALYGKISVGQTYRDRGIVGTVSVDEKVILAGKMDIGTRIQSFELLPQKGVAQIGTLEIGSFFKRTLNMFGKIDPNAPTYVVLAKADDKVVFAKVNRYGARNGTKVHEIPKNISVAVVEQVNPTLAIGEIEPGVFFRLSEDAAGNVDEKSPLYYKSVKEGSGLYFARQVNPRTKQANGVHMNFMSNVRVVVQKD